jgi:NADH-quinone oxidoreductase subunit M
MILWQLIALLLAGGALAWWSEKRDANTPRWISLCVIALALFYFLATIANFSSHQLQLVPDARDASTWLIHYQAEWIPRFGISFELALDGLSLVMIILTFILGGIAVIASWDEVDYRPGFFQANLLWVLAGVIGVLQALDFFLFLQLWEVNLIPM